MATFNVIVEDETIRIESDSATEAARAAAVASAAAAVAAAATATTQAGNAAASAVAAEAAVTATIDRSQRWYVLRRQLLFAQCDVNRAAQMVVFLNGEKREFTIVASLEIAEVVADNIIVGDGSISAPDRYYLFQKQVATATVDDDLKVQFATFVDGTNSVSVRLPQKTLPVIACLGDSLTQGTGGQTPFPSQLASNTGRTTINLGIGGQTRYQIAARIGALGVPMTVADNSLSSGSNSVTAIDGIAPQSVRTGLPSDTTFYNENLQLLSTQDGVTRTATGTLGSVHGTLQRTTVNASPYTDATEEIYTFTPDAGSTLPAKVPPGTMFIADYEHAAATHVFWLFRNDFRNPDHLDLMDACIRRIGHDRYIIMGVINGDFAGERSSATSSTTSTGYEVLRGVEDDLANRYGGRFLHIRRLLIDKALPALAITPTAQDLTDVADDTVPESLRTDGIHLTTATLGFIADEIETFLESTGY